MNKIHIVYMFLKIRSYLIGQKIVDQYIDLILQCGTGDSKAISTLCEWKNRRSVFWTDNEKTLHTGKAMNTKLIVNYKIL